MVGPGAAVGTVPTDLEQATGLERLEILGKMQGIDVFDMKPLDASRLGTFSPKLHTLQISGKETANMNLLQARLIIQLLLNLLGMSNTQDVPASQLTPIIPSGSQ